MDIVISEIPQACLNKSSSDIKWVKTVNDNITNSAYLPPDTRPKQCSLGIFFHLEVNSRFGNSLMEVPIGDIILLYQRLNKQRDKCFTHLVTPIDNNLIQYPYTGTTKRWCGRLVKVIAMTGNQTANSIPFSQTMWSSMGFTGKMHDLSFQCGRVFEIPTVQQLPKLQNDIWNKFQSYIVK